MRSMIRKQVLIVLERQLGLFELAFTLDVDQVAAIDEDVGHRRIGEQRFERSKTEQLVKDIGDERLAFRETQRRLLFFGIEQADDQAAQLGFRLRASDPVQSIEVQPVEQRKVHALLERVVVGLTKIVDGVHRRPPKSAEQSALRSVLLRRLKAAKLPRELDNRAGQPAVIG